MIESFLFLFTGIIGLVTLTIMLRSYRSNPFCNLFLVLIISIISFRFFIHGSYNLGLQTVFRADTGISSILYLIIVPCSYLYYKYLTFPQKTYNIKDLKHLIFIVFLYFINSNEALDNSFIFYFGSMTNLFYVAMFLIFYLVLVFRLLSKKIWFRKNLLLNSKHFKLVKNWTLSLYIINTLSSIMILISLYTEFSKGTIVSGKTMAIFSLFFWLFIFFKILVSPEILYGLPILNKTLLKFNDPLLLENKESIPPINIKIGSSWVLDTDIKKSSQDQKLQGIIRSNIESYIHEIDKLSTEQFIFRNHKVSQSDIGANLGVPTSHIVYLFKYHSKISFSEYRKNCRIQDAVKLIKEGFLNSETLESLAYTTGFASYNPFFIAFKNITTYSPQDYVKLKKS
ncbi:AraC family transcriptional regulator [Polaribacter sp. MSW13]|uniref:AraC family transcriptional regulator n=1 Tax=Polaribacter marinus TaxID=2916838 RepID=A0A9X2AK77_9FLAO|nr:AraC family transcriptional regulator [Polaribacter marinus]MCI2227910.1 AraC family transcriptional regulator [Polaribacter marinus]